MQRIADLFEIGAEIEDPDGIVQAKKTRKKVIGLANGAAQQLLRSQNQADRELGKKLKIHYDNLSPVRKCTAENAQKDERRKSTAGFDGFKQCERGSDLREELRGRAEKRLRFRPFGRSGLGGLAKIPHILD